MEPLAKKRWMMSVCSQCGERHSDALTCEQVGELLMAERAAGWDPRP